MGASYQLIWPSLSLALARPGPARAWPGPNSVLPHMLILLKNIPQTVLALRGSDGVGREWLWFLSGSVRGRRGAFFIDFYSTW